MTTCDAWLKREGLSLHLGGGLLGAAAQAFAAFRKEIDAGRGWGWYDLCTAEGVVPGSFAIAVLTDAREVDQWRRGERIDLTGAEAAALVEEDGEYAFSVVEY